jgi:D-hydroxyproline dehydrogenase subunit beta
MNSMGVANGELHADVGVVGAGMVGLAHALEARRRGMSVVLLERDSRAVGASVRNFGHLFVGSQPDGPVFDLALRSRQRWLELAAEADLPLVQQGTLLLARAEDELAVLETATANAARGSKMLTTDEALALAPLPGGEIVGALHSQLDLRVNPRVAVARLAALLESDPSATVLWSSQVHAVEPGVLHTGQAGELTVRAPAIVVCPGPDYADLTPDLRSGLEDLTRCRLQMLRAAAPAARRYGPALATGLSLIRYPAFAQQEPAVALRARLERERPELLGAGIHLLVTQLPDGDLIIGDSHAYGDTLDQFADEHIYELLLAEAGRLLGAEHLAVRERWLGFYAARVASAQTREYEPFHVSAPMTGVRVVENVTGIGMTLSLGYAPTVLDGLLSS